MKTSTLIVLCSSLASFIVAAEPPTPSKMHLIDSRRTPSHMPLIDRSRAQTNASPPYRVSISYDLPGREPLRYDYGPRR